MPVRQTVLKQTSLAPCTRAQLRARDQVAQKALHRQSHLKTTIHVLYLEVVSHATSPNRVRTSTRCTDRGTIGQLREAWATLRPSKRVQIQRWTSLNRQTWLNQTPYPHRKTLIIPLATLPRRASPLRHRHSVFSPKSGKDH